MGSKQSLVVTVRGLDGAGNPFTHGQLCWDGTSLTCKPPTSVVLRSILHDPVCGRNGQHLDPSADPVLFLEQLPDVYRSAYLNASLEPTEES